MSDAVWSIEERYRVVRGCNLPSRLRHVLLVLFFYQGKNQTTWAKRETLADEIGVAPGTFSNLTKSLEDIGVIARIWTRRNGRSSREYAIQFSELEKRQRSPSQIREPECDSTLTDLGGLPSQNHDRHFHESMRHEVTNEHQVEDTAASGGPSSSRPRDRYPQHFEDIWHSYPTQSRTQKAETFRQYKSAIARIKNSKDLSDLQAQEWLLDRLRQYAASYHGQKYPPRSYRWFEDDRFEDADKSWDEFKTHTAIGCPEFEQARKAASQLVPGDDASLRMVKDQLPLDVFQAARPIIYDINNPKTERSNQISFANALKEIRNERHPTSQF